MINTEEVLSKQVTFLDYVFDKKLKRIKIIDFLNQIRNENQKKEITRLRGYFKNNKKEYEDRKKLLPSITFSGLFDDRRTIETIQEYNGLCIIDIDHIPEAKIQELLEKFYFDPYIISYWISPSGEGIKGLAKFKYLTCPEGLTYNDCHRYAFSLLNKYMRNNYNTEIDNSGNDITRLCFISSDSNLVIKDRIEEFEIDNIIISSAAVTPKKEKNKLSSCFVLKEHLYPVGRNKATKRNEIQGMIKFLESKNLSITSDYERWFRIAYAIANTFTYDIGKKYFLRLCQLDGPRHDEEKSINMLQYCYVNSKRSISFGTIKYYFYKSKEEWGRRTKEVSH